MVENPSVTDERNGSAITEDEAALYDRQIRLWGLDAQKRLRASCVLLVGIKGLGAEICKNLVLSGVKSVTIVDPNPVNEQDFVSQFLVQRQDIGKNIHINDICHDNGVKFFAADVFGFYGYMFADLGEHKFVEEEPKIIEASDNESSRSDGEPKAKYRKVDVNETTIVQKFAEFYRLKAALACKLDNRTEKILKRLPSVYFMIKVILRFQSQYGRLPQTTMNTGERDNLLTLRDEVMKELNLDVTLLPDEFASHCTAEVSPICAIVGGIVGQEVVKAVSGKDAPLNNFFFYNGLEGHGTVECFN
ncbi:SUMO-activating enzyme subunit 1 [Desmophyllum pertusum]|uniref:SUMO-activating enzyme subunit 1 n=1 Tax=Desmophyllum pertusum TaxID=174260 RepID=A0A9W9Z1C4_9CNID|nr:SUMO-activating enzyme subunit 1 [Desmophyllum pertusum]